MFEQIFELANDVVLHCRFSSIYIFDIIIIPSFCNKLCLWHIFHNIIFDNIYFHNFHHLFSSFLFLNYLSEIDRISGKYRASILIRKRNQERKNMVYTKTTFSSSSTPVCKYLVQHPADNSIHFDQQPPKLLDIKSDKTNTLTLYNIDFLEGFNC